MKDSRETHGRLLPWQLPETGRPFKLLCGRSSFERRKTPKGIRRAYRRWTDIRKDITCENCKAALAK